MDDTHRAEARQWLIGIPDLAAAFARLDVNGDGLLSRPELQALVDYGVLSGSACNALMYMGDTDLGPTATGRSTWTSSRRSAR